MPGLRFTSPVGSFSSLPPKIPRNGDIQMKISRFMADHLAPTDILNIFSSARFFHIVAFTPFRTTMRGIYYHIGLWNTTHKEYFIRERNSPANIFMTLFLENWYEGRLVGYNIWEEYFQWRNFWIAKDLWWWLLWTYSNSSVRKTFENVRSLNPNIQTSFIAATLERPIAQIDPLNLIYLECLH